MSCWKLCWWYDFTVAWTNAHATWIESQTGIIGHCMLIKKSLVRVVVLSHWAVKAKRCRFSVAIFMLVAVWSGFSGLMRGFAVIWVVALWCFNLQCKRDIFVPFNYGCGGIRAVRLRKGLVGRSLGWSVGLGMNKNSSQRASTRLWLIRYVTCYSEWFMLEWINVWYCNELLITNREINGKE